VDGFRKTADAFRPGALTLPGEYYTSSRVFAAEAETIFGRLWTCAGRCSQVPRPGDYTLHSIGAESIILVRGRDGVMRAHYNVCRHRGTRLCSQPAGHFTDVIQCPYHAWTYSLDGQLVGAPHMQDVPSFDRADYPLHQAAVAEYGGFAFVNGDPAAPSFASWCAPMTERLERFDLASLEPAHRAEYVVHANWKLVFQNYSECLHCPVIHPGLSARISYQSGANDLVDGPFLGGYMELAAGHESVTPTGRACAPPISPGLPHDDRRRAYYYSVMPNLLLSVHPDYVNYYVLTPLAVDRTAITSEWLFRAEQRGASFDPEAAVQFWDEVNRQDWHIIEQSQLGIASTRYRPGPYSPRESISAAWDREYLRLMGTDDVAKENDVRRSAEDGPGNTSS
jgi:Rieske 2Fe-2S family protein